MAIRASLSMPAVALILSSLSSPSCAEERTYSAIGESVLKPKAIINAMRLARRMAPPNAENVSVSPKDCSKAQDGSYRCEAEVTFEVPEEPEAGGTAGYGVRYGYVEGERPTRPSSGEIVLSPTPRAAPRAVDEDALGNYLNADNGRGQRADGTLLPQPREEQTESFLSGLGGIVSDAVGTAAALAPAAVGVAGAGALRTGNGAAGLGAAAPAPRSQPAAPAVRTAPQQRGGGSDISGTDRLRERR